MRLRLAWISVLYIFERLDIAATVSHYLSRLAKVFYGVLMLETMGLVGVNAARPAQLVHTSDFVHDIFGF